MTRASSSFRSGTLRIICFTHTSLNQNQAVLARGQWSWVHMSWLRGSFQFSNPSSQNLIVGEQIWWTRPVDLLAGFASQEWSSASGQSLVSGGDSPGGPGIGGPAPPPSTSTNIHAVIISARSDPAKIVTSPNVTLVGGVVALGKDPLPPAAPTNSWSTGLRIVPDEALLTGARDSAVNAEYH